MKGQKESSLLALLPLGMSALAIICIFISWAGGIGIHGRWGFIISCGMLLSIGGALFAVVAFFVLLAGRKLAENLIIVLTAFVLGAAAMLAFPQVVPLGGCVTAKTASARSDLKAISQAIDAYYKDHQRYPPWGKGDEGYRRFAPNSGAFQMHTFRHWRTPDEQKLFDLLTTPVPYLKSYPRDPYATTRGATYGYYTDGGGYILFSRGPDTDEGNPDEMSLEPDIEKVYRSSIQQPSLTLITGQSSAAHHSAYTYDVTNGTVSPGDIWRVKQ